MQAGQADAESCQEHVLPAAGQAEAGLLAALEKDCCCHIACVVAVGRLFPSLALPGQGSFAPPFLKNASSRPLLSGKGWCWYVLRAWWAFG